MDKSIDSSSSPIPVFILFSSLVSFQSLLRTLSQKKKKRKGFWNEVFSDEDGEGGQAEHRIKTKAVFFSAFRSSFIALWERGMTSSFIGMPFKMADAEESTVCVVAPHDRKERVLVLSGPAMRLSSLLYFHSGHAPRSPKWSRTKEAWLGVVGCCVLHVEEPTRTLFILFSNSLSPRIWITSMKHWNPIYHTRTKILRWRFISCHHGCGNTLS